MREARRAIIRTMRSIIRNVDPLRGTLTAEHAGQNFYLDQLGAALMVRRHSDGRPVGRIDIARRGGDIHLGEVRIAEYLYDEKNGYLVVPLSMGAPDMPHAVTEHPVDYLLREAVR